MVEHVTMNAQITGSYDVRNDEINLWYDRMCISIDCILLMQSMLVHIFFQFFPDLIIGYIQTGIMPSIQEVCVYF